MVRNEKDDSSLQVGSDGGSNGQIVRNHGSGQTNKTTVSVQHIGSKERVKSSTTPVSTPILGEDEDINLLVEIGPNTEKYQITEDFHRILSKNGKPINTSDTSKQSQIRYIIKQICVSIKQTNKLSVYHLFVCLSCSNTEFRKYLTDTIATGANSKITNSSAQTQVSRSSHGRHLGSHHRTGNRTSSIHRLSTNVTLQTPARPTALYETPEPFSVATECNEDICRLPDCFCGGSVLPGNGHNLFG